MNFFFCFFTLRTTSFHFAILASSRNGWTGGAIGSAERGFWISHRHTPRFRDGNVSAPHTPRIPRALSRWEGFAWRSMSYSERIERVEGYELEEGTHFLPVAIRSPTFSKSTHSQRLFLDFLWRFRWFDRLFNKLHTAGLWRMNARVCGEWGAVGESFLSFKNKMFASCLWLQRLINNGPVSA